MRIGVAALYPNLVRGVKISSTPNPFVQELIQLDPGTFGTRRGSASGNGAGVVTSNAERSSGNLDRQLQIVLVRIQTKVAKARS
jgi:hypothetical protein